MIFIIVILSGVRSDEGGTNGVEGSLDIHHTAECPEILRLRNSRYARIAPLRMTVEKDWIV
jgi:hypothetical protein